MTARKPVNPLNFGRRGKTSVSNDFEGKGEIVIVQVELNRFLVASDPGAFRYRGEALEHGLLLAQAERKPLIFFDGSEARTLCEPQS